MSVAARTPALKSTPTARALTPARRIVENPDVRAVAGLALLLSALAALTWQKWGVPSVDPGHELTTAATIAEGGEPYRDIRYYYGPVGVYALGGTFAVFGTSFTAAFAFGLAQAAAIVAAFYALSRRLLDVLPAFIATAIVAAIGFSGTALNFILPHTNSATFGILFTLLMLLALSKRSLWWAGLAAGLVCLTRPEFAAVALFAIAAYAVGSWRQEGLRPALKTLPPLLIPTVAVAGAVLGLLAAETGSAKLFTENLWPVDFLRIAGFASQKAWAPLDLESLVSTVARATIYCSMLAAAIAAGLNYSRASRPTQRLAALWPLPMAFGLLVLLDAFWLTSGLWLDAHDQVQYEATHLLIGMSWLPALGFAAAALVAIRLFRRESAPISGNWGFDLALVAVAAALGSRAYDAFTAEGSYAPYYAAPLVLLLAVLHQRLAQAWPRARAASYAFLAAVAVGLGAYALIALYPDDSAAVHTQRGSFVTTPSAAPALQGTVDYIDAHTTPGEPILAVPLDSGLHFMTDRPAALYDAMFLPGLLDSKADELEAISQLESSGVRYAVIDQRRFSGYRYERFGIDYNQRLSAWLTRAGAPVAEFGGGERVGGTNPSTDYLVYRIDGK